MGTFGCTKWKRVGSGGIGWNPVELGGAWWNQVRSVRVKEGRPTRW